MLDGRPYYGVNYEIPAKRLASPCSPRAKSDSVLEAIKKADVLIEAMGWIREFRDSVTVIKLGGSLLDDEEALRHLLIDVVFMESVGMKPVIVHGGGKAINRAMDAAGLKPRFVHGRRYTDDATLQIVEKVLGGEVNEQIAGRIEEFGGRSMPLNAAGETDNNVLFGEKLLLKDESGKPMDLGHVGHVTRVDRDTIENISFASQVPVIPCLCRTKEGGMLNVNADTAAMAVAQAMGAEKLVFLSDVNGVRRDKDDETTLINSLSADEARELIQQGVIAAGMIPKIEACLEIISQGVRKVHIIDGRIRHSLLLEVFTNQGVGTEITGEP